MYPLGRYKLSIYGGYTSYQYNANGMWQVLPELSISIVYSSYDQKSQQWLLSEFAASKVHERGAINQGIRLLWAPVSEFEEVPDFENQCFTRQNRKCRKFVGHCVHRRQAIDPRIHVAAIEPWETECILKYVVKALSIVDLFNRNLHDP